MSERLSPVLPSAEEVGDGVGPVLTGHPRAQAVLEAIRRLNPSVEIHNRGSICACSRHAAAW